MFHIIYYFNILLLICAVYYSFNYFRSHDTLTLLQLCLYDVPFVACLMQFNSCCLMLISFNSQTSYKLPEWFILIQYAIIDIWYVAQCIVSVVFKYFVLEFLCIIIKCNVFWKFRFIFRSIEFLYLFSIKSISYVHVNTT